MATLQAMFYSLAEAQYQMLVDLLFDTSTRKTTMPGAVDTGGDLGVTGNISVTGTVDGVDVDALNTTVSNHVGDTTDPHGSTRSRTPATLRWTPSMLEWTPRSTSSIRTARTKPTSTSRVTSSSAEPWTVWTWMR